MSQQVKVLYTAANWDLTWNGVTASITGPAGSTGVATGVDESAAIKTQLDTVATSEVQTLTIADCGGGNTFTIGFANWLGVKQSTAALVCDASGTLADATAVQNALLALGNWPTVANYATERRDQPDATVSASITSASPLTMEITIFNGGTFYHTGDIPLMAAECTGAGASTCAASTAVTATETKAGFFTVDTIVTLTEDHLTDSHVYDVNFDKKGYWALPVIDDTASNVVSVTETVSATGGVPEFYNVT